MRLGMRDRLMPPRYLLEKVVTQAQSIADDSEQASPFNQPAFKLPKGISQADQRRLHDAINRMRSVTKKVIAIGLALRHKGTEVELKRKREYRQLLRLTRQILNDSRRVLQEVETLPARRRRGVRGLGERLETVADQVRRGGE